MKQLVVALLFIPVSLFATTSEPNKTLTAFERLCQNTESPNLREKYCQQVINIKKAEQITKDLQKEG
ncbi:hypothetical protein ACNVED_17080 (plasmid) [Legionella sp. D16C41]|uniref:hypothetical protein n=1 Tax=Legionella sp. D16C41 TaxID=3402688 RepID=UPI003AF9BB88